MPFAVFLFTHGIILLDKIFLTILAAFRMSPRIFSNRTSKLSPLSPSPTALATSPIARLSSSPRKKFLILSAILLSYKKRDTSCPNPSRHCLSSGLISLALRCKSAAIFFMSSGVFRKANVGASLDSGAGASIPLINLFASDKESKGAVDRPSKERTRLTKMFTNLFHGDIFSPLGTIPASFDWNLGLLITSATNSCKFCAPYAVSS